MVISSPNTMCGCASPPRHATYGASIEPQLQEMMVTLMRMMQTMMMAPGQSQMYSSPSLSPGISPNPGFGSFLGSGSSGASSFRGQASGNSAWTPQTGAAATSSDLRTNGSAVSTLMNSIQRTPVPPGCARGGYCYRGVKHHLRQIGVNLTGGSAYMAADQLARSGRFREVQVPRSQLRRLPAGAVVVWNRGPGKPHGHISIANGRGQEASGRIRNQITNYPSTHRVFLPR